jgi:hypothetical protein
MKLTLGKYTIRPLDSQNWIVSTHSPSGVETAKAYHPRLVYALMWTYDRLLMHSEEHPRDAQEFAKLCQETLESTLAALETAAQQQGVSQ